MKFTKCVNADRDRLEQFGDKLQSVDPELPKDQVIFEEGVLIRDDKGYRMVVQVVTPNDPESEACWSQAVLFSRDGRELAFTEPQESLVGEWVILYDMNEYHLILVPKGQDIKREEKPKTLSEIAEEGLDGYEHEGGWKLLDDKTILVRQGSHFLRLDVSEITEEEYERAEDFRRE